VADFLTVRHEYAPLIDLALGERAQRFVVRDADLLAEALRQRGQPFSGRVSFLVRPRGIGFQSCQTTTGLESYPTAEAPLGRARRPQWPEDAPAHPGVLALAEQLVTCDRPGLEDLPAQLLRRTLLVRDLDTARHIAAHTTRFRLITLQGQLLEPDGPLRVGTHHAEAGILSRKSELRELREQAAALDRRIADTERDLADLRDRLAGLDQQTEQHQEEIDVLAEQAADLRSRI